MAKKKVVVIGAGVLGLGTAFALSQYDEYSIVLIEREYPGIGSTSLAAGMALRTYTDPIIREIASRAYQILEDLTAEGRGLTLRRLGSLMPAHTQEDLASFEEIVHAHRKLGGNSRVVNRDDIAPLVPGFAPAEDVVGGLWDADAAFLDGTEVVSTLVEAVKARGVRIFARTSVVGLTSGTGNDKYLVETSTGVALPADIIVNAAGAWGGQVGEALGAPLNLVNERHEAFIFRVPELTQAFPMFLDFIPGGASTTEGLYFRGEGTDRIIAGTHTSNLLHTEETIDPNSVSQKLSDDGLEKTFGLLSDALPDIDLGYEGGWAGIYPHHALNTFVLGPHPENPDIIVGAGLGGRGLGPGVALGEILAEWIVHGRPITVPEAIAYVPGAGV